MAVVLTDLYARGATIVSSEKGYGIYFRREDTLYFVELMADDDRSAEVLMEAAGRRRSSWSAPSSQWARLRTFSSAKAPGRTTA